MVQRFPWIGFSLGFLFGVLGIWLLGALSLAIPFIESASEPLFAVGRFAAQFVQRGDSVGTVGTVVLFVINGLFYGLIGALLQWSFRAMKQSS